MRPRAVATLALAAALAGPASAAAAGSGGAGTGGSGGAPVDQARLQGDFIMVGRITQAVAVPGERRGQRVTRRWSFDSTCPGPCATVTLMRQRAGGSDKVVLHRIASDLYSGSGSYYLPVRCGRRVIRRGELAPFSISVRVVAVEATAQGVVATGLRASYTGRPWRNLTGCVAVAAHDSARYGGLLLRPAT